MLSPVKFCICPKVIIQRCNILFKKGIRRNIPAKVRTPISLNSQEHFYLIVFLLIFIIDNNETYKSIRTGIFNNSIFKLSIKPLSSNESVGFFPFFISIIALLQLF